MKLNNKGLTIIELIITMALISIVLIFLYRLLLDINNELTNNSFAIDNVANRFEIIKNIQNDFINTYEITEFIYSNNNIAINLTYRLTDDASEIVTKSGDISISFDNSIESVSSLTYNNIEGVSTKWIMEDSTIGIDDIDICYINMDSDDLTKNVNVMLYINIPIYNGNDININKNKNNIIDDIQLSYIGRYEHANKDGIEVCK